MCYKEGGGERERERMVKYQIRNTFHIIMRSCGSLVGCDDTREQSRERNFMISRIFAYAPREIQVGSTCARGRRMRAWMCPYAEMCVCKRATPRNARMAPMAVNATRLERSRLRNAVPSQTQW